MDESSTPFVSMYRGRAKRARQRICDLEELVAASEALMDEVAAERDAAQQEARRYRLALEAIPCRDCGRPVGWPPIEHEGILVAAVRCGNCAMKALKADALGGEQHG